VRERWLFVRNERKENSPCLIIGMSSDNFQDDQSYRELNQYQGPANKNGFQTSFEHEKYFLQKPHKTMEIGRKAYNAPWYQQKAIILLYQYVTPQELKCSFQAFVISSL